MGIYVEVRHYKLWGCQCGNLCRGKVLQTMGDVDVGICVEVRHYKLWGMSMWEFV